MIPMPRWVRTAGFVLAAALIAAPASAQIVQGFHMGVGVFYPRQFDSRDPDDVLVQDLTFADPLEFSIDNFRSGMIFGEWTADVGSHLSFGVGVSYYSDRVPSRYLGLMNDIDGSDIAQDLRLKMIPITGMVRFMPFGSPSTFQPYVGIGVAAIPWRYNESGQFIDVNGDIFTDRFTATGTAFGPVLAGGFRAPVGGDIYALTMEWKYQFATGNTGGSANNFLGDKIDLSGGTLNFGFLVRF